MAQLNYFIMTSKFTNLKKGTEHFNLLFLPSTLDGAYAFWRNKGFHPVANLYIEDTFASFEQLNVMYNFPRSHFFRFLQICDFACKNVSQCPAPCLQFIPYQVLVSVLKAQFLS